jgi:peroxiredoxin
MRFLALLVGGLLFLGIFATDGLALGGGPQEQPAAIDSGSQAPDFTLETLDGETVTLSDFRGKVVFLNFWASWCPPCRAEMPSMERLNEVFDGRDFVMLAVNVEQDPASVRQFLEQNSHSFTVLLDPDQKAQRLYQVYRFPESFLIDKQGMVIKRFIGGRNWSSVEFMERLNQLTKG